MRKPTCNPRCVSGTCVATNTCSCDAGYSGANCGTVIPASCGVGVCSAVALGGAGHEQVDRVAIAPNGDVVVGGVFHGTTNLGGGDLTSVGAKDVFIARYSAAGAHRWSRRLGSTNFNDFLSGLIVAPDGAVVAIGTFADSTDIGSDVYTSAGGSDVWLARWNADGTFAWSRAIGSEGYDHAGGVGVDASGAIVIAAACGGGTVNLGGADFTNGPPALMMARYTAAGAHVWSQAQGGGAAVYPHAVAVTPAGEIAISGEFSAGSANFGGADIAAKAFLVKYGPAGAHVWSRGFTGTGGPFFSDVAVAPNGDVYLANGFYNQMDFGGASMASFGGHFNLAFAKYAAADGAHIFSKHLGGWSEYTARIAVDAAGFVALVGTSYGSHDLDLGGGLLTGTGGGSELVVARFTSDGAHIWSKRMGGASQDQGIDVAVDAAGDVVAAGNSSGPADFGSVSLPGLGSIDGLLVRLGASAP